MGVLSQVLDLGMSVCAADDDVHILAQNLRKIRSRFAFAKADILPEKQTGAAKVGHPRFKADSRPERLLFKDHRHHTSGEQRLANPASQFGFEIFRDGENSLDI